MIDYNLTFKEAILEMLDGKIVESESYPDYLQRFSKEEGYFQCVFTANLNKGHSWMFAHFLDNEINGNWRIISSHENNIADDLTNGRLLTYAATKESEVMSVNFLDFIEKVETNHLKNDENESHIMLLERRMSDLEEKLEKHQQ